MQNNNSSKIFIGELIRKRVDELHIPYAEFARRINCSRTSLYNLFTKKSIDTELLITISEVLEYDFLYEVYNHIPYNYLAKSDCSALNEQCVQDLIDDMAQVIKKRLSGGGRKKWSI